MKSPRYERAFNAARNGGPRPEWMTASAWIAMLDLAHQEDIGEVAKTDAIAEAEATAMTDAFDAAHPIRGTVLGQLEAEFNEAFPLGHIMASRETVTLIMRMFADAGVSAEVTQL